MSFHPKSLLICLATLLASSPLFSDSAFWTAHETDTVQWRHWEPATLQAAEEADLPLFFFVGHYGNSLARSMLSETFKNQTIASTLNETAIPVLVDINQNPEFAALLGQLAFEHFSANELPTCLWTDTTLAPLNGGGYFPPTDDWGGQGFLSVARNVSEQWQANRDDYLAPARDRLQKSLETTPLSLSQLSELEQAFATESFSAKETPSLDAITLYNTARYTRNLAQEKAQPLLDAMHAFINRIASGAGFDSVDGGFFIGSNDANWKLPLFQKSATDQAYLLLALAELQTQDPKPEYEFLIELTIDFIERKLIKENGLAIQYLDSFAAGETPDMAEGSYYLIEGSQVPDLPQQAIEAWGLSAEGNLDEDTDILGIYKGFNIPTAKNKQVLSDQFDSQRDALRKLRSDRPSPLSDKTGYTSTSALLVRALSSAATSTGTENYEIQARQLFERILASNAQLSSGILFNSDRRAAKANSNDYCQLVAAALALKESTGDPAYSDHAESILGILQNAPHYHGPSLARAIGIGDLRYAIYHDASLESPLALHLENLQRLGHLETETVNSTLSSLPKAWVEHPARLQSLVRFAESQAN